MIRNIVGTLVDIASHRLTIAELSAIFEAKDRRLAGRAAPPQGLFLIKVFYPN
jgi:tRNA pseudouridine38-40 synthase